MYVFCVCVIVEPSPWRILTAYVRVEFLFRCAGSYLSDFYPSFKNTRYSTPVNF